MLRRLLAVQRNHTGLLLKIARKRLEKKDMALWWDQIAMKRPESELAILLKNAEKN